MTTHRETDPEGDSADAGQLKPEICPTCGGPADELGCMDENCPEHPDYLDDEFEEGLLGEGDIDA